MLKKLFIATLLYAVAIFLMHRAVYGVEYTLFTVSDAIFYVALPMFFISLVSITNAGNLFLWFGYSIKGLFNRGAHTPYHQYHNQKMKKAVSIIPFYLLVISTLLIIASLVLASMIV